MSVRLRKRGKLSEYDGNKVISFAWDCKHNLNLDKFLATDQFAHASSFAGIVLQPEEGSFIYDECAQVLLKVLPHCLFLHELRRPEQPPQVQH